MKSINAKDIKTINWLLVEIFEEEDNEFVDRRIIVPKYRKIDRILERITSDKKEQRVILEAIDKETFNTNDYTFKPIVENLKALGYEIVYTEKEK